MASLNSLADLRQIRDPWVVVFLVAPRRVARGVQSPCDLQGNVLVLFHVADENVAHCIPSSAFARFSIAHVSPRCQHS